MKRKNGLTIAVIVALCLTAGLSLLYALTPYLMPLAERNSSGFDLDGIVTDDAGKPLNGVTMQVTFSRSKLMDFNSPDMHKDYRETVNSKFHIRQNRFTGVEVTFSKTDITRKPCAMIPTGQSMFSTVFGLRWQKDNALS